MRVKILREQLLKPLGLIANVVERRHTLPVLANALITVDDHGVTLVGTDLEVELRINLPQITGEPGEITVPARKLFDICRALPAEAMLELRIEKDRAIIKSQSSRFTLSTMPSSDFPSIEASGWAEKLSLPQRQLRELLEHTQFCMAQQDVRYYLNGLLLEFTQQTLRAVATDGHRLALGQIEQTAPFDRQVIVPRKGVQEALRFLDGGDAMVDLLLSPNHIRFVVGGLSFTSKLIDGRFPDYNKVIPRTHGHQIRIAREKLRETLARVAILSNEKYRGVRVGLAAGRLTITAHNPEHEEAQEEVEVEYTGPQLEIGFNVTYLIDAIAALQGAEVQLGVTDADSSGSLKDPGSDRYVYVVMPMRL